MPEIPPPLGYQPAALPADEPERLRTLRLHQILDTAAEQAFDDLVNLAALICDAPIAAISLVDTSRQWFKAKVGLSVASTPRDMAFCAHAILGTDLMVVDDATVDPRFAENPLVTGDPRIRFYVGAPLVMANGTALGTVCVIDRKPRTLSATQLRAMQLLQRTAVHLVEVRRARLDLEAMAKLLPLCSWCRNVRNDKGEWVELHRYVQDSLPVTHGICPACMVQQLAQLERR